MTTGQLSDQAIAFLGGRALDLELALRFGLRSDGGGDVLVFPFSKGGKEVGCKFRRLSEKKFWQTDGGVGCAWNGDVLDDPALFGKPLIIAEGEFDALAAIQAGFGRVISIPDGAPSAGKSDKTPDELLDGAKYGWLRDLLPKLRREQVPEIIIAADGDASGGAMLEQLSLILGRVRCKFLTYPKARDPKRLGRERLKDLNEVLEDYGVRGVAQVIAGAKWLQVDGVYAMSELPPLPAKYVYDIGFNLLGENFKVRLGDLSVATGIPSHGKSTWANDLWCRVVTKHGLRVAWASFEQQPQEDHLRNLRTWYLRCRVCDATPEELAEADAWIDRHHRFIVPKEDEDASLAWVLQKAQVAVVQHGCNIIVIDPWNELEHVRDRHLSLTEYVSSALKEVRRFARAFGVHVMIVAHPTKSVKGEGGAYRRPTLYDISDSAAWYNKADLGVIVHRPNPDETEIVVEKSRYHQTIGVPGKVVARFVKDEQRYSEIGRESMYQEAA